MSLYIEEIKNKEIWESFLLKFKDKTFLQSWNWAELQKKLGNKIWRLGIYNRGNLICTTLIIKIKAKRGTFLFLPHGPIILPETDNAFKYLIDYLKKISKKENCDFIRISPILERNKSNLRIFKENKFRQAPIHMHPEITWQLDLTKQEEKILMGMRKTTRYLIKKGNKNKKVKIYQSEKIKDLKTFYKIHRQVVKRQHFIPFSLNYLEKEFLSFDLDNEIKIFLGEYNNKIISSAIIVFWQGIAFYHHGASSSENRKVPASYSLQWEIIKEAKRRNCELYNFWGIAPQENKNHPWAGLSLFKKGFGGYEKKYIKTQDLPISKKYWFNFIIETIRRINRGL